MSDPVVAVARLEERLQGVLTLLQNMEKEQADLAKQVAELKTVVTGGSFLVKTLIALGAVAAAVISVAQAFALFHK